MRTAPAELQPQGLGRVTPTQTACLGHAHPSGEHNIAGSVESAIFNKKASFTEIFYRNILKYDQVLELSPDIEGCFTKINNMFFVS